MLEQFESRMLLANAAPSGMDVALSAFLNNSYAFAAADFGFSDSADLNSFLAVKITTLPTSGKLTDDGQDVSAGQFIPVADLNLQKLKFKPAVAEIQTANFTFQVQDDGLTLNGGIDLDPTPNTVTFDIVWQSHPPFGQDHTVVALEDTSYKFQISDFPFTDLDTLYGLPQNLAAVTILSIPSLGGLSLFNGTNVIPLTPGQIVQASDIAAGRLKFLAAPNAFNPTGYASFAFKIQDDGVVGVNSDLTPHTQTIDVLPVNDMPSGIDRQVTTFEDAAYQFSAVDFPITDTADSPPNALLSVKISSLPITGQLQFAGVPIQLTDPPIAAPNLVALRFVPAQNCNDLNTAKPFFSFQVQDDGGSGVVTGSDGSSASGVDTDSTPNTIVISVTSVPDPPQGGNNTITALEDGANHPNSYTFKAADIPFSDPHDNVGNGSTRNNLSGIIITQPPTSATGVLKFNGNPVASGQMIPANQISQLTFTPTMNGFGAADSSFTYQAVDDASTNNIEPAANAHTITINVTAVNDPPIGADNSVTTQEDIPYTFQQGDFPFSDAIDNNVSTLKSVKITSLSLNGGILTEGGVVRNAGDEIAVSSFANGPGGFSTVLYTPPSNKSGTPLGSFTFRVRDNGGTANGGIDLDQTDHNMTIVVQSVNDPPIGSDRTRAVNEAQTYTFSLADFPMADPQDTPPSGTGPANTLDSVIFTVPPSVSGAFKVGPVIKTPGSTVSVTAANLGTTPVTFTPIRNTTISFRVKDNGGTVVGGSDTSTLNNFVLNVTNINSEPQGTDKTVHAVEDTNYTVQVSDFGFSDPFDAPPNNFKSVIIATLPASGGQLKFNGVAVIAGQEIPVQGGIAAGLLTYKAPADNLTPPFQDRLTFQVKDDGGTATIISSDGQVSTGVDIDQSPNTLTLSIYPVNDRPVGADNRITLPENGSYSFSTANNDFTLTDPQDTPANGLSGISIASLPARGTLSYNGSPAAVGAFVSKADLDAGNKLVFTPDRNSGGTGYASFKFFVSDNGGTAVVTGDDGSSAVGANRALNFNTMTMDVFFVPQPPQGDDSTVTIPEDTTYALTAAPNGDDFHFSDVNDLPGNNFVIAKIVSYAGGSLTLNNATVNPNDMITVAQINAGQLKFTPTSNVNGANEGQVVFQVQDDADISGGGHNLDVSSNTLTFNVAAVNDAPAGTDNPNIRTAEDTTYWFIAGDFGFTDPNDNPANNLQAVKMTTVPANGTLTLFNGTIDVAVNAGQTIPASGLSSLKFMPAPNHWGTNYASFTFQVQDNGGTFTATGGGLSSMGVDLDQSPNTITINVTSVNDPPVAFVGASPQLVVLKSLGTGPANTHAFTPADFGFTDPYDTPPTGTGPANHLHNVIITQAFVGSGALTYQGGAIPASIPAANIGQIVYTAPLTPGSTTDPNFVDATFRFKLQDDGGNSPNDMEVTDHAFNIHVTTFEPGIPFGFSQTATTNEDTTYAIQESDFGFHDSDSPPHAFQAVIITAQAANSGSFKLYGTTIASGALPLTVQVSDIRLAALTYVPPADASGSTFATLSFRVQDNGGTSGGGQDTSALPANTLTVNVLPVNDPPTGLFNNNLPKQIDEDTTQTLNPFDFGFADTHDTGAAATFTKLNITSLPTNGVLTLNGATVTLNQAISVTGGANGTFTFGNLIYTPNINYNGADTFTFKVQDGGGTATNPGFDQDTDLIARTAVINIASVNDAPRGTTQTIHTLEDTAYFFANGTLTGSEFGFSDLNDDPQNNFVAVTFGNFVLPSGATLKIGATNVAPSSRHLLSEFSGATRLVYTPAPNSDSTFNLPFQVEDDGGLLGTGAANIDPIARTLSIALTQVNDAPTGADLTISIPEDTTYTVAYSDFGFTDPADNFGGGPAWFTTPLAVKIAALNLQGGTLLDNANPITIGTTVLKADFDNGLVTFQPAINFNNVGATPPNIAFAVQDAGGLANGGNDTDSTPNIITFNVLSVDDKPQATAKSVVTNEDTPLPLAAANFGYSDVDTDAPNNLLTTVKVSAVSGGTLFNAQTGSTISLPANVAKSDLDAGRILFVPTPNASGYAFVTYQLQDGGSTTTVIGGGTTNAAALSAVNVNLSDAQTLTVTVNSVSDAPVGQNKTVAINEDQAYPLAVADFGFTDPNDTPPTGTGPANNFQAVRISSIGAAGTLTLNGVPVNIGQVVFVSDLGGNLVYTPPANANGSPLANASIGFQVQDNGGIAFGGANLDPTVRLLTFNVTPVNDPPKGIDKAIATSEDTAYSLDLNGLDFEFSDPADSSGSLTAVRFETVPSHGTLRINGTAVTASATFNVPFISFSYTPSADYNGPDAFTFKLKDDGSGAGAGASLFSVNPNTISIIVNKVDDAPVGADGSTGNSVTVQENSGYTFQQADFGFSDPKDSSPPSSVAPNTFASVEIVVGNLNSGSLKNGAAPLTTGQTVTLSTATINSGALAFTPATNSSTAIASLFTFKVIDTGSSTVGTRGELNQNKDLLARTMGVNITRVDIEPVGGDNTKTINQDGIYAFTTNGFEFNFSDPQESPSPDLFAGVIITTTPSRGTLLLGGVNGTPVTAGQFVSPTDLAIGLGYVPVAGAYSSPAGSVYASFTFQVKDNGGSRGGQDTDQSPNTFNFIVIRVKPPPQGGNNIINIPQAPNTNSTYVFAANDFNFHDPGDVPPNNFLAVHIGQTTATGSLTLNGVPVTPGQRITVNGGNGATNDIFHGNLKYTPPFYAAGNPFPTAYFTFSVEDDGTSNNVEFGTHTMQLNVIGTANMKPTPQNNAVTINEDQTYTFALSNFPFTDAESNNLRSVIITVAPQHGQFVLNGVTQQSFPLFVNRLDIMTGNLQFQPDPVNAYGLQAQVTVRFNVQDDGGTAVINGVQGKDSSTTPATLTINVQAVNDPPVGTDKTITVVEDTAYHFRSGINAQQLGGDFAITDPNDAPIGGPNNLKAIRIESLPTGGMLLFDGQAVVVGQLIDASSLGGAFTYQAISDRNGTNYDKFTFRVKDDGGTANGGVDLATSVNTITINVASVNDPPVGSDVLLSMTESTSLIFSASNFGFTDPQDMPANSFGNLIITLLSLAGGTLKLGATTIPSTPFTVPANSLGQLSFTPAHNSNDGNNARPFFTFKVQDSGGTATVVGGDGSAANGVDTSLADNTVTISVSSVNNPPDSSQLNNIVTTVEDRAYTFQTSDFNFTDANDAPPNAFIAVRISSLPHAGQLLHNGQPVVQGELIPVIDISSGNLVFQPAANANGPAYASFMFQVKDNGGTAFGGNDLDPIPNSMTVAVLSVNDAPRGADRSINVQPGAPATRVLTRNDFGYSDPLDSPQNDFQSVIITALPNQGSLKLNNGTTDVTVTLIQTVSIVDIDAGQLKYIPAANQIANDTIKFRVQDNGGTATLTAALNSAAGIDTDLSDKILAIHLTAAVPIAPVFQNTSVNATEDLNFTFQSSNFPFTDVNGDNFQQITIGTVSDLQGTLTLNGTNVQSGTVISASDLATAKFVYRGPQDKNGANFTTFTFTGTDDGGAPDTDATPHTVTINLGPVNDPPVGADKTVATTPYGYTFAAGDFASTTPALFDPADVPSPNNYAGVIIASLPFRGSLTNNGNPVSAGTFITKADLDANRLVFTPNSNELQSVTAYATFTFQVKDTGGTATVSAQDTDQSPNTITISVAPVNDPPVANDDSYSYQGCGEAFTVPAPGVLGNDTDADGDMLTVQLLVGAAGILDLHPDGGFSFTPSRWGLTDDGFIYRISDGHATSDGFAAITYYWPQPLVRILPFAGATLEDTTLSAPAPGILSLVADPCSAQLPLGLLAFDAVSKYGGSISAQADGSFVYHPPLNFDGTDQFTYVIGPEGGPPSDFVTGTATIAVTPVNDPPGFKSGPSQGVLDTSGPQAVDGWATNITPGPEGPAQTVHFFVTNDKPALFAAQPAVDETGRLTFEPKIGASGVANVTVVAVDDGGTANGGVDTSPPQTFTIGVALDKPLHNRAIAADVTGDGNVVPEDVIDVINFINAFGSGPVTPAKPGAPPPALYYDVTGDNYIAADDVVTIINYINAHATVEQEAGVQTTTDLGETNEALLTLLAADAAQVKRRKT